MRLIEFETKNKVEDVKNDKKGRGKQVQ